MPLKMLQVTAPIAAEMNIRQLASEQSVISCHKSADLADDHALFLLLTRSEDRQKLVDKLHVLLQTSTKSRIVILPVDATLPAVETAGVGDTREELYQKMGQGARMDFNYFLLTCLSTIVAIIGLLQDNVAVVVGAMVIAPFLGPNLAFAFATSQGDRPLMVQSFVSGVFGISVAILLSAVIGYMWQGVPESGELTSRTVVGLSGVALAAASGVAGVLSLTTGLSMTLVGVMVAVALLPPAATLGFMLGSNELTYAFGAFLLLSVNIVSVNLSGLVVFMAKGIKPRHWLERKMAKPYVYGGILFWTAGLVFLVAVISMSQISYP